MQELTTLILILPKIINGFGKPFMTTNCPKSTFFPCGSLHCLSNFLILQINSKKTKLTHYVDIEKQSLRKINFKNFMFVVSCNSKNIYVAYYSTSLHGDLIFVTLVV
jgi:hypothetical protein